MVATLLTSCKKDFMEPITPTKPIKTMNDLKVPANFDWKTSKEVNLNLIGYAKAPVTIKDQDGVIVAKAMLSTGATDISISLPTYVDKVWLEYMGQSIEVSTKSNIKYIFN